MRKLIAVAVIFAMLAPGVTAARTQYIVLDLSASNSFPGDKAFVDATIRMAIIEIAELEEGDTVVVQTIGELSGKNLDVFRRRIDRRQPKEKVIREVALYLRSFEDREIAKQLDTNLLGYFYLYKRDCAAGDRIFLVTDGLESSSLVDDGDFLQGKASLPSPSSKFLSGCHVHMFGIAQQSDRLTLTSVLHIVDEWTRWTTEAGGTFEHSAGVSDS